MEEGTTRAQLDAEGCGRFLRLRRQLGVSSVGINQIVLQPGNRGPRRLVLLALGGEGEHIGRDGEAFSSWSEEVGAPPQEVPLPADLNSSEIRA
jgi:hypothetical protein